MYPKDKDGLEITRPPLITTSPDGYIRLSFQAFRQIPLVHLMSGLDEENPVFLHEGASAVEITGYTEWVSTTLPTLSIGWDWVIQSSQNVGYCYRKHGRARSNIMLIDARQCDLGSAKSSIMIDAVADEISWQGVVENYISTRYAP